MPRASGFFSALLDERADPPVLARWTRTIQSSAEVRVRSPHGGLSEAVERQLVATLFNQRSVLVAGNAALTIVAVVGWLESAQGWFLIWAIAIAVTLAARLAIELAFDRRSSEPGRIAVWGRIYTAGSWATGALLGCSALVIVKHVHPLIQMLVLSTELVFIMGSVARVCACPVIAKGQALLGLVPIFVVCVLQDDVYYRVFSLAICFELYAAFALLRYLNVRTVRLLRLNEENTALVAEVQRTNAELIAANVRLEAAATTDSLTGIENRRRFDAVLAEEVRQARRHSDEMALLMLDIDSFKGFNDLYGHQAGDECLRRVAQTFAASLRRPGDFVARYGGEEFVAVLPRTNALSAAALAETVRANIAALAVVNAAAGSAGVVTVSIGVTSFSPDHYQGPEDLIRAADEALYSAKGAGRNCVRIARNDGHDRIRLVPISDVLQQLDARH